MSNKQWVFDNPQEAADLIEQQQQRNAELEQKLTHIEQGEQATIAHQRAKINELAATVERLRDEREGEYIKWQNKYQKSKDRISELESTVGRLQKAMNDAGLKLIDARYVRSFEELDSILCESEPANLNRVKREALIEAAESLNHAENFAGVLDFIIEYDALIEYANERYPD